ncbi:MAG: glycosyl transferase [Candidatus Marinimicrobia bacterium]|nr:glycosyl transferase [Candidatus Neomarinimicrobiota bacterium]
MMSSKKILYALNGTGSGHITRARQLIPYLRKKYDVDILISGKNNIIDSNLNIKYNFKGFTFIINKNGRVSYLKSLFGNNLFRFIIDLFRLNINQYDLIISDFEPISAWASKIKGKPSLQLSHQSSLFSKKSPRPKNVDRLAEFFIKWYSPCDRYMGFHFKNYDSNIYGPLLRDKIINASPQINNYYVVYLWNYSSEYIVSVLSQLQDYKFKVFDSQANKQYAIENCEIIPTGDDVFFNAILNCKGVICGAGFELPAEVLYLKKKLYVIPIGNQYEQKCNAQALIEMGVDSNDILNKDYLLSWLKKDHLVSYNLNICNADEIIEAI